MSLRWDNLCAFCHCREWCENNHGDTCGYTTETWEQARADIVEQIQLLEPEEEE